MILERLEGGGNRAGLGFALGQGGHGHPIHPGIGGDPAEAETEVFQGSRAIQIQADGQGLLGFTGAEAAGPGEGLRQQGQPAASQADGFPLLPQPGVEAVARADAFRHGGAVQPQPPAPLPLLQGEGGQNRGLAALPDLQQKRGKGRQIGPALGCRLFQGGPGAGGAFVQAVLGEQQVGVGGLTAVHGQAASHMADRAELGHREAIDLHFDHRLLGRLQMGRIRFRQRHAGQQPVIEGNGDELPVLTFHLGQQAGGVALQDALHAPLGGAATTPFPGDLHQNPVTVPGVIELVVADVDVLAAVFPQGETEPLAGAPQPGGDQFGGLQGAETLGTLLHQPQPQQGVEADAQFLLAVLGGQPQGLLQLGQGHRVGRRKVIEQIGDRELHQVGMAQRMVRRARGRDGLHGRWASPEADTVSADETR